MLWIVVPAVAALIAAVALLRIGGQVRYGPEGLDIRVLVGPLSVRIYPLKKRRKRRQTEKSLPPERRPEKAGKAPNTWQSLRELLPIAAEAAGELRRKIRIDCLELCLTVACSDPMRAAVSYGAANAGVGMLLPILEQNFDVREREIRIEADFQGQEPSARLRAAATLRVGQAVSFGVRFGLRLLKVFWRSRPVKCAGAAR